MPRVVIDLPPGAAAAIHPSPAAPHARPVAAAAVPETRPVERRLSRLALGAALYGLALVPPAIAAYAFALAGHDGFAIVDDLAREGERGLFRDLAALRYSEAWFAGGAIFVTWLALFLAGFGGSLAAFFRARGPRKKGRGLALLGLAGSGAFFFCGSAAIGSVQPALDLWRQTQRGPVKKAVVVARSPSAPTIERLGAVKGLADRDEPEARAALLDLAATDESPAVRALAEQIVRRWPKTETGGTLFPGELEKPAPGRGGAPAPLALPAPAGAR